MESTEEIVFNLLKSLNTHSGVYVMKRISTLCEVKCDCLEAENQLVLTDDGTIGTNCRGVPLRTAKCAFWDPMMDVDEEREI